MCDRVDIVAISVLAVLSGGAFSHARLAFFLVPVAVAFRFRPAFDGLAVVVTTATYVIQAVVHPARAAARAVTRFIVTQAGYLAWVGVACVLLSSCSRGVPSSSSRLADDRSRLLADALDAEQRERKALAEALHDHAIQNLLSARHELEEAAERRRTRRSHAQTRRSSPTAGSSARPSSTSTRTSSRRRGSRRRCARSPSRRPPAGASGSSSTSRRRRHAAGPARLLGRARAAHERRPARRTRASSTSALAERNGELVLVVEDDGAGFPPERPTSGSRTATSASPSQRVRVEAAGGHDGSALDAGRGTRVEVRVPEHVDGNGRAGG